MAMQGRLRVLTTLLAPSAYYFYCNQNRSPCVMEGSGQQKEEEEKLDPLSRLEQRLNKSGLPINVTNNFSVNLITGGAIVLYWGGMYNLLDRYFFAKRVPNRILNGLLRITFGIVLLTFQDDDIKEIGYGLKGDDDENNPVLEESDLPTVVGESLFLASRGYNWCGDSTSISKDQIESIFRSYDLNKNEKLEADELLLLHKTLLGELQAYATAQISKEKEEAKDDEEEEVDRFRDIERFLRQKGMSLNLHHAYFQNIWLGTGIITIWSGLGTVFNSVFGARSGHAFIFKNVSRLLLGAALIYLPGGDLNVLANRFLDKEKDPTDLHRLALEMCIMNALQQNEEVPVLVDADNDVSIPLKSVIEAYDRLDANKDGVVSIRELILCLAKEVACDASIPLESVIEAYDRLDANKDGVVSTRELILILAKGDGNDVSIPLESVVEAYDRLDANKDGVVSTRELISSLAK